MIPSQAQPRPEPQPSRFYPIPDKPFPNPLTICRNGPDGWTLLVNPDTAATIAVNRTGALIWRLANGKRTVKDIVAGVRRRFSNAPGSVEGDVTALLTTLSEAGLIGREIPLLRPKNQELRTKNQ